jgi:hypothetical protein
MALAVGFNLDAIASIGSAVALLVFSLVSVGHFRVRSETGARASVLVLAVGSALIVLVTFTVTTLVNDLPSLFTLVGIIALSIALDIAWKHSRASIALASQHSSSP